ncbi:hypothetical protein GWN49_04520, partial [Candidatus Bathyarchaeota archaeon]|nr:hypothetical protein [Candidatus Bathyarchaeota archaeon]
MNRKAVSGIMLTMLLVSICIHAFDIRPVKAEPDEQYELLSNACMHADGDTDPFSAFASGTSGSANLQEGNNLPRTQLQLKQSRELEDNRIFGTWSLRADIHTEEDADRLVGMVSSMGSKWVHVTIDWRDWEQAETTGEYSRY